MDTSTAHPTRPRYARGEGDRLRDDLLEAAAELMATHDSIEQVSLRAIARRAGVSATAVYRHFDDHLDLLRASVRHCWTAFDAALRTGAESDPDPFVAFRHTGDAYVRFAEEHRGQYRVLFSNAIDVDLDGGPSGPEHTIGMETFQLLVDLVTAMLAANGDERDPFYVAKQVHTWMHGIVDLCGANPAFPWPSTDEMLEGLQDALRLRPSAA